MAQMQVDHPAFNQDKLDIDLNPKIVADWMCRE